MDVEEDSGGGDIPEWVVTFGDMMSLLLAFFIMLFSLSEMKQDERFQAMLESMRRQFGHEASMSSMVPGMSTPKNSMMRSIASMGRAKRKDIVRGGNKVKSVSGEDTLVRTIRPGKDTTLGGIIFFDEDDAVLDDKSKSDLRSIASQVAGKPLKIEVRGHTSRKTLHDGDHWQLAYDRCRVAMQYLVDQGIDEKRIRLGSAGAHEPFDDDLNEESRRRNARVEVLMWDEPIGNGQSDS